MDLYWSKLSKTRPSLRSLTPWHSLSHALTMSSWCTQACLPLAQSNLKPANPSTSLWVAIFWRIVTWPKSSCFAALTVSPKSSCNPIWCSTWKMAISATHSWFPRIKRSKARGIAQTSFGTGKTCTHQRLTSILPSNEHSRNLRTPKLSINYI